MTTFHFLWREDNRKGNQVRASLLCSSSSSSAFTLFCCSSPLSLSLSLMSLHQTSWKIHSSAFNSQPKSSLSLTHTHTQVHNPCTHTSKAVYKNMAPGKRQTPGERLRRQREVREKHSELWCRFVRVHVCVRCVFGVPHGEVCCERLSEHVMCDRWQTVSISFLKHIRKRSYTQRFHRCCEQKKYIRFTPAYISNAVFSNFVAPHYYHS